MLCGRVPRSSGYRGAFRSAIQLVLVGLTPSDPTPCIAWALLHAELSRPGMTPSVENPLRALTQAALRGDVQYGHELL